MDDKNVSNELISSVFPKIEVDTRTIDSIVKRISKKLSKLRFALKKYYRNKLEYY